MSKRRKTSYLWSYFTIQDSVSKIASCDYCGQTLNYKTTITNLRKHLERRHKNNIMPPVTTSIKTESGSDDSENPDAAESPSNAAVSFSGEIEDKSEFNEEQNTSDSQHYNKSNHFFSSSPYSFLHATKKSTKSEKLDKLLLQMFFQDYQPFTMLNDEGFVSFVNGLNPSYKLPNKKTITHCLLPDEYDRCMTVVRQELTAAESVCLCTETWTSDNRDNYLGVTAHYVTEAFELRSLFLECSSIPQPQTSANQAEIIRCIINKFHLFYKVFLVVSDYSFTLKSAVTEELKKEHFDCFAYTLNFILSDALKIPYELITKIKSIVNFFQKSSSGLEKLNAAQTTSSKPKKLILDEDSSMWNSTFYMIQRFSELEEAIKTATASVNKNIPVLTEDEWTACHELAIVLEPFEDVTKEISEEHYVTGSLIIPLANGLRSVCEKMQTEEFGPVAVYVIHELLKGINAKLGHIENNKFLALATFLDPRFKLAPFANEGSALAIKEYCANLVAEIWAQQQTADSGSNSTDYFSEAGESNSSHSSKLQSTRYSVWENLDSKIATKKSTGSMSAAIIEVNRYVEDAFQDRRENPLVWWKNNQHYYPLMSKLVRTKFNVMGTSLPCDRLFTKEGQMIAKRRSRLPAKNMGQLLFLNANSFLLK